MIMMVPINPNSNHDETQVRIMQAYTQWQFIWNLG